MDCSFASDNVAPLQPTALAALAEANRGPARSYGDDPWTQRATDAIRTLFEQPAAEVFFVANGTAANALALASLCQSYHAVVAGEVAHVETDECGAPEFYSNGSKLLLAQCRDGRIAPGEVARLATRRNDLHYPRPRVLTLTDSTELGTVYRPEQVRELAGEARAHGLAVHMDGARLANALAACACAPADLTWRAGVQVLSLGGNKPGCSLAEAVVFFDPALAVEFEWRCKQAGQLMSKLRFAAAPWAACLADGSWLSGSRHANAMAAALAERLRALPGVRLLHPVEANAVFVELPEPAHAALARSWAYYRFIGGGARFMCSWATTPAEIDHLVGDLAAALRG